jgi:hypothetical protein
MLYANCSANLPGTHRDKPQEAIFDSDSFLIQVNSGASRSISNCKAHFKSLEPIDPKGSHKISSLTGEDSPIKGKGTLKWKIEDDDSAVHMIRLKDSLYIPAFKTCLLYTQHWSQSTNDHLPQRNGTWQALFSDKIVMYWDQHQYKKTVSWDSCTNTGYL